MDLLTVVSSHLDGAVCLHYYTTISYQQLCGQVDGYQEEGPDAFRLYIRTSANIN